MKTSRISAIVMVLLAIATLSDAQSFHKRKHKWVQGKKGFGFYSQNELSFYTGYGNTMGESELRIRNTSTIYEMKSINGYKFGRVKVGIGLGLNIWDGDPLYPLGFHSSYDLFKNRSTPFALVNVNYLHGRRLRNEFEHPEIGKFSASLGIGYKHRVSKKIDLYAKVMLSHRWLTATNRVNNEYHLEQDYNTNYGFIKFAIGIELR